ncbi:MAG TPA: hypothetical protein PLL09_01860 [Flavobacterium sp.]|uniref:hypothetical protein n=2 Tax=Flavobacterium TaxID=237 RepID=UPI0025B88F21|nr:MULTISPECIES: hypothetical protein [unclassified Flavobacterium]HRE76549.1 hypothetical protein [Flavobacterium sp.]
MSQLKIIFVLVLMCLFSISSFGQVGINTTMPLSTLDINGNLSLKSVVLVGSAAPTLIDDGVYISLQPLITDQEFRLPNAVDFPGRVYVLRNIQNTITARLTTAGGLLFPKTSTTGSTDVYMYEGNNRSLIVISDGINWTYFN